MIEKLEIKNFKSINDKLSPIEFKRLNILCGENASGKTSIIHAILLCTQSKNNKKNVDGNILKIGNYSELKNRDGGEIVISVKDDNDKIKKITFIDNKDLNSNQLKILSVEPPNDTNFEFEKTIFYLNSNRTGTMDTYSKGNFLFGIDGANTVSFLDEHQGDPLGDDYMTQFTAKYKETNVSENKTFLAHVRFWMEKITGEQIFIDSIPNTNQIVLTFGNKIRPINTGSGYSFLLPMIISTLGIIFLDEPKGNIPTLIIENPEIFLHPDAQQKLMEFFSFCKNFCQFIIETHSEYIIKSAVETSKTDMCIYVAKKENGSTKLYKETDFKTDSYLEILYKAFGILTPEFHILLYGKLQNRFVANSSLEPSLKKFDDNLYNKYLRKRSDMLKTSIHEIIDKRTKNKISIEYRTLPTFIRNVINHPGSKDPVTKQEYTFTDEELKNSIDFLLSQL